MPDAVLRTLQIFTHWMLLQLRAGDKLSSVLQMRILCQRGQVTYLMSHSRWVTEPGFKPRPPGSRNCKILWKRKMWRLLGEIRSFKALVGKPMRSIVMFISSTKDKGVPFISEKFSSKELWLPSDLNHCDYWLENSHVEVPVGNKDLLIFIHKCVKYTAALCV